MSPQVCPFVSRSFWKAEKLNFNAPIAALIFIHAYPFLLFNSFLVPSFFFLSLISSSTRLSSYPIFYALSFSAFMHFSNFSGSLPCLISLPPPLVFCIRLFMEGFQASFNHFAAAALMYWLDGLVGWYHLHNDTNWYFKGLWMRESFNNRTHSLYMYIQVEERIDDR